MQRLKHNNRHIAVARLERGFLSDFARKSYQNVSRETFWYDCAGDRGAPSIARDGGAKSGWSASKRIGSALSGERKGSFTLQSSFTLSNTAPAINPVTDPVTLQVGTFTTTIPPGSFKKNRNGTFTYVGVVGGVSLQAVIAPTGTLRYAFVAAAQRVSLTGTKNPVPVMLAIGANSGTTSVKARIF
jgi:hypothetical protein